MNNFFEKLRSLTIIIAVLTIVTSFTACSSDDPSEEPESKIAKKTILMFLPYADGLYDDLVNNVSDFKRAIVNNGGLSGNKLLVYISRNQTTSFLIDINYKDGQCTQDTLSTYTFTERDYTTVDGLASILEEVKQYAPATEYSLCIGCHGGGWLPVDKTSGVVSYGTKNKSRMFGSSSNPTYQINTTTLAEGIEKANMKMEFILFDCCYMSNIETAYDLKDVTNYIIASTCEILDIGMPYKEIGLDIFNNNYQAICNKFYEYYANYESPCGQIAVLDLSKIDNLAAIMKTINNTYPDGLSNISKLQKLDGYYPTRYFDYGDYIDQLCDDESLKASFNTALNEFVIYKQTTNYYYTYFDTPHKRTINKFSGLTISEPSTDLTVISNIKNTNWYKASH